MSAENFSHSRSKLNDKLNIPTFWELIKTIPTIRSEWHLKTPLSKWCHLYGIGRVLFIATDYRWFKDDQSLSVVAFFPFLYFGASIVLAIYTVFYYLAVGEPMKCLPCTCIQGISIATLTLMALSVSNKRFLTHDLIDFGGYYIYPDEKHEDIEYVRICSQQIDKTVRDFFTKIGILFLAMCTCVFWPVYSVIMYGTQTTTLDVKIPFVESHSDREFLFNSILMLIIATHAGTFYVGLEVAVSIWVDIATAAPKLIAYEFEKLDDILHQSDGIEQKLRITFRNIAKQILDTNDYMICLADILYFRTLVTPFMFTFSIAISIFCQYSTNFAAGYGMAMMSYTQFFYICDFGEYVEDNGISEVLYDANWYKLPTWIQKSIGMLIHSKQNAKKLTIGPFDTINRELYKVTVKRTYTFVMFLFNFVE